MKVLCTYNLAGSGLATLTRSELAQLVLQARTANEQFSDLRTVIDEVAPDITPVDLRVALRLYHWTRGTLARVNENSSPHRIATAALVQDRLDRFAQGIQLDEGGHEVYDNQGGQWDTGDGQAQSHDG